MKKPLEFHFFDTIDSTQTQAKKIHKKSQVVHVVVATAQTQGKGRLGATWVSPENSGLYVTLAFKTGGKNTSSLSHLAACAACLSIDRIEPQIRWPNDILVKEKKIGGVMTEIIDDYAYCGIGINLCNHADFKNVTDQPYTSYDKHSTAPDLKELCKAIATTFNELLESWDMGGFKNIKDVYTKYFQHMHKDVIVDTPEGLLKGKLIDFSDEGYPVLQQNSSILIIKHLGHINAQA